ncbi:MAG TPA: aldo/keto reductase [Steroidobacteraceae bacterium]|nr:aldo/keto reductase [Steroidobacteraceae bacterium]
MTTVAVESDWQMIANRDGAAARVALGRSGIEVAPLGWGMWRFAGADVATALRRIEAALEIGCTLFDTADIYGYGTAEGFGGAERLLGLVLRSTPGLRQRMVLATKAGIFPPLPYNSSAAYLVQACEKSLQRLGVECIDLFQIHRPDLLAHPAEVAAALAQLRQSGKIRAAGVSNYSAAQLDALCQHLPFPLASIQPEFSPLAIEPLTDGVLDAAMRLGVAVLAWSPLGQGRLGAASSDQAGDVRAAAVIGALERVALRAGVPRSAVAYAWVMAHPSRPIPLIGSQNPSRIREAAAAYEVQLQREEWYQILEAARGEPLP